MRRSQPHAGRALGVAVAQVHGPVLTRREGAGAALEALEKMVRSTDLGEVASIQREWVDGAIKRLTSDIATLTEQTMALSQEAVAVARHAAQPDAEAQASSKRRAVEKETQVETAA